MAASQSNAYKNQRRNEMKILTRQAIFINEYVQTKYKDIYIEAANLYNEINKKYSQKPDLRKTTEFRQWKNNVAISNGQTTNPVPRQKEYKYNRTKYRDIILAVTTETSAESPTPPEENHHLDERIGGMTMCLNIPLMATPRHNTSEEIVMEEGDQTLAPSTPHQISPVIQEGGQTLAPSTPHQISPVIQEGGQTLAPSTPHEALDPSIMDQVSPEIMEKIIRELQLDPNLKDMMDDVQQQINTEEELIGLEIDLPELDDLLEEELQLW